MTMGNPFNLFMLIFLGFSKNLVHILEKIHIELKVLFMSNGNMCICRLVI